MKQFSIHDNPNKIVEHLMMCSGMGAVGSVSKPTHYDIEWNGERYEIQAESIDDAIRQFEQQLETEALDLGNGWSVDIEPVAVIGFNDVKDCFEVRKKAVITWPLSDGSDYYHERG